METFQYYDFQVPEEFAVITGAGGATFKIVADAQLGVIDRTIGIEPHHHVLEPGCGVGRLAIPLTRRLSKSGSYHGFDVTRRSVEWCAENISKRYNNFKFTTLDILSHMYNPQGKETADEIKFPVESASIDRIVLNSVFTHMFEPEIRNYLSEFRRVLKPDGRIVATWFVVDRDSWRTSDARSSHFSNATFRHRIGMDCYVTDIHNPLGAIGYTEPCMRRMVEESGLVIQSFHRGYWSGVHPDTGMGGQDTTIIVPGTV